MPLFGHEGHDEEIIDPLKHLAAQIENMQPREAALKIAPILARLSGGESVSMINRVTGITDDQRRKLKDAAMLSAMFDLGATPGDVQHLAKKEPGSPSLN